MLQKFQANRIAKKYYWLCRELKLPKFLQEELLRASSSIALNIGEGAGKNSIANRKKFYSIALGNLRESHAIIELEKVEHDELKNLGDQLAAM